MHEIYGLFVIAMAFLFFLLPVLQMPAWFPIFFFLGGPAAEKI